MREVCENLFVGSLEDYETGEFETNIEEDAVLWYILHAAKEPFHRQFVCYFGERSAPKDDPEYLTARRGDRLALNLIDVPNPQYIPKDVVDAALAFIDEGMEKHRKVFVHCNQGHSRAPSLALLWMASKGLLPGASIQAAEIPFRDLYPGYSPADGIRGFIKEHWREYVPTSR